LAGCGARELVVRQPVGARTETRKRRDGIL
jgi:hypothetical protein